MKPSTKLALDLLRANRKGVTTHDLIVAGVGARYSSRISELRHDHGCVITEQRLPLPARGSRYQLISGPEPAGDNDTPARPSDDVHGPEDACDGLFDADQFRMSGGAYDVEEAA